MDSDLPVVAVASGKGGVGKTTVAVNVALALAARGTRVGLVDADLYGPDVPRMMGLRRRRSAKDLTLFAAKHSPGARLEVVERHGVQLASAGFLIGEDQAVGMPAGLAQLLVRRLLGAAWADVECLVVDLPPGTGDVQQFVFALRDRPVYVLLVSTPQMVAQQDVRRLMADLRRHDVEIVGGVENMCGFVCPCCGERSAMFPPAPEVDGIWSSLEKLADIPFSPRAAADADQGRPVMVSRGVPEQVTAYESVADELRRRLAE